jgi:hypothetical protein
MITFDVPNLDCDDDKDLEELGRVMRALGDYAHKKATAMQARRAGAIDSALGFERSCDRLYESLPEWARW